MRISGALSFSFLIGIIAFLFSVLGFYLLDSALLASSKTFYISIGLGVLILVCSYFIFNTYIKSKFKKIFSSIGLDFQSSPDFNAEETQLKIQKWLDGKASEIDKLKSTQAYRNEFFGNLAHELKTPVFSVEGYILTLLEGGLEDEKINRKFLKKAAKGVDRITKIIGDMDTISSIESGNLQLDRMKIPLFELVNNVVYELEDLASAKNIEISIEKPDVAELFVLGDRLRLEQVFGNLIANSIHYGKKGGASIIQIKEIRNKAEIIVRDNGIGILKEHLPRLFERFYRVEKSRDRNQGGSGIGLAIVKHVIEAHGQNISVSSEFGQGTSFCFSLEKG